MKHIKWLTFCFVLDDFCNEREIENIFAEQIFSSITSVFSGLCRPVIAGQSSKIPYCLFGRYVI